MRPPPTTSINIGNNRILPQPNNTPNVGPTQNGQTQNGQTQNGQTQNGQMLLPASVGTNVNVALPNSGAMGSNASVNTQVGDGRSTSPHPNHNSVFQSMKNAFENIPGKSFDSRSGFYPDDSFPSAEVIEDNIVYLREVTIDDHQVIEHAQEDGGKQGLDRTRRSASIEESGIVYLTEISDDTSDSIPDGKREIGNGDRTRPEFNSREGFLWEPTPFPSRQNLPTDFIAPTFRTSVDEINGIGNLPTQSSEDSFDNIPDGKREI